MFPGFISRHTWIVFVVGSRLTPEGSLRFPLSTKTHLTRKGFRICMKPGKAGVAFSLNSTIYFIDLSFNLVSTLDRSGIDSLESGIHNIFA